MPPESSYAVLPGRWAGYPPLQGRSLTCYAPVRRLLHCCSPRDLHVLSTPPAFVLSQDQTLQENSNSIARTFDRRHTRKRSNGPKNHILCISVNSHRSPEEPRINESASHSTRSTRFSISFGAASAAALKSTSHVTSPSRPSTPPLRQRHPTRLGRRHRGETEQIHSCSLSRKPCRDHSSTITAQLTRIRRGETKRAAASAAARLVRPLYCMLRDGLEPST